MLQRRRLKAGYILKLKVLVSASEQKSMFYTLGARLGPIVRQ